MKTAFTGITYQVGDTIQSRKSTYTLEVIRQLTSKIEGLCFPQWKLTLLTTTVIYATETPKTVIRLYKITVTNTSSTFTTRFILSWTITLIKSTIDAATLSFKRSTSTKFLVM